MNAKPLCHFERRDYDLLIAASPVDMAIKIRREYPGRLFKKKKLVDGTARAAQSRKGQVQEASKRGQQSKPRPGLWLERIGF